MTEPLKQKDGDSGESKFVDELIDEWCKLLRELSQESRDNDKK